MKITLLVFSFLLTLSVWAQIKDGGRSYADTNKTVPKLEGVLYEEINKLAVDAVFLASKQWPICCGEAGNFQNLARVYDVLNPVKFDMEKIKPGVDCEADNALPEKFDTPEVREAFQKFINHPDAKLYLHGTNEPIRASFMYDFFFKHYGQKKK